MRMRVGIFLRLRDVGYNLREEKKPFLKRRSLATPEALRAKLSAKNWQEREECAQALRMCLQQALCTLFVAVEQALL